MKSIEINRFVKKIVESGTKGRFTLLAGKKPLRETQNIQKLMRKSILIKNNACGHSYKITLGKFIESKKACKTCLSTKISPISDESTVIYNSLHNTQTI